MLDVCEERRPHALARRVGRGVRTRQDVCRLIGEGLGFAAPATADRGRVSVGATVKYSALPPIDSCPKTVYDATSTRCDISDWLARGYFLHHDKGER